MLRIRSAVSWCLLALLLACGAGGCHDKGMPETYPVAGVVTHNQGQPFSGGVIRFQSSMDNGLTLAGVIQQDGTFTLSTNNSRSKVAGAPEGWYQVSIIPLVPANHRVVSSTTLQSAYRVEAKENFFHIHINAPRR